MIHVEAIASRNLLKFGTPTFATSGAAAIDLRAMLNDPGTKLGGDVEFYYNNGEVTKAYLAAGQQITVDTGLRVFIGDRRYCGLVLPRSGLGSKGLVLGNGVGLIDSDYQGPLLLTLWNRSKETIIVEDGMRVAQYVLTNAYQFKIDMVSDFAGATARGAGGFGSTGSV